MAGNECIQAALAIFLPPGLPGLRFVSMLARTKLSPKDFQAPSGEGIGQPSTRIERLSDYALEAFFPDT